MPASKAKSGGKTSPDLLALAFEIIAETGWRGFSFTQLAERADLPLGEVRKAFRDRAGLLAALNDRLDQAMLGVVPEDLEGLPTRDRVFELIMSRLEAMAPFRAGLCRLMKDARFDPGLLARSACRIDRSLTWLQEAAGLSGNHRGSPLTQIRNSVQRRVLGAVYLQVLNVWSGDDSGDLANTMTTLDKQLRRVESLAGLGTSEQKDGTTGAA
jgi:AcrR family transcriptional regulator